MDLETSRRMLLEHSRSKKNGEFPDDANLEGKLANPICGDTVYLKLHMQNHQIQQAGFAAEACAICTASASLLCDELVKVSILQTIPMVESFEAAVLAPPGEVWPETLNKFRCFEHLRKNPARKACALLPFVLLRSILKKV
jgi:nitrogen fixation protein NifU and related proteins